MEPDDADIKQWQNENADLVKSLVKMSKDSLVYLMCRAEWKYELSQKTGEFFASAWANKEQETKNLKEGNLKLGIEVATNKKMADHLMQQVSEMFYFAKTGIKTNKNLSDGRPKGTKNNKKKAATKKSDLIKAVRDLMSNPESNALYPTNRKKAKYLNEKGFGKKSGLEKRIGSIIIDLKKYASE